MNWDIAWKPDLKVQMDRSFSSVFLMRPLNIPELIFKPIWTEADYLSRFQRVQDYLRAGDCYQVNLTFPMSAESDVCATQLYAAFRRRQPGRYGAVVSLGETEIISFSPELFFERKGQNMRMRPMKGTRPRANDPVIDRALLVEMKAEPKSQAENLMIVDLLRNDLSRLCMPGSVKVPELFALETYPTLHQMTSQVTGTLKDDVNWEQILRSLFPCGSVTGAPKIRAMEIIEELEAGPRGAYCGSVGYIAPSGDASFSVAIRTIQKKNGRLRYDVGSGVVLDSDGLDEYRECLLKAHIFNRPKSGVIETFRQKANGDIPLKLALSRYPLTEDVQDTYVKTTSRSFYDGERHRIQATTNADEIIFQNLDGQICEGAFTSIFIEKDGKLFTPKLSCGLLAGVLREEMIETKQAFEAILTLDDLKTADAIFVGNSLRGLMPAILIDYLLH